MYFVVPMYSSQWALCWEFFQFIRLKGQLVLYYNTIEVLKNENGADYALPRGYETAPINAN